MNTHFLTLHDPDSDARAHVLPGRGFNCYSFQVPLAGTPIDVLWSAADFVSGEARASSSGIPILFPFPGRLGGTSFTFEGKRYELRPGDPMGNAIHGFVLDRPWRVLGQSSSQALGQFTASIDAPEILDHWPSDFELTADYRLSGQVLSLRMEVKNLGADRLPFGLGLHPYFRVPLGGKDAADCQVFVPVQKCWELKDMLPTGRLLSAAAAGLPDQRTTFGQARFDHVFTDVATLNDMATSSIFDPESDRTTELKFDAQFRECVVYTPGHREAICIEPYTCVPDAYRLADEGHETGLRVLAPGEVFVASVSVKVEDSP